MRTKEIILLIAMIILIIAVSSIKTHAQNENFYSDLNYYRKSHLLKPLIADSTLENESMARIIKIQTKYHGALIHGKCSDGQMEVLAKNCDLDCWMYSKAHKKILLSRKARRIGFITKDGIACARLSN